MCQGTVTTTLDPLFQRGWSEITGRLRRILSHRWYILDKGFANQAYKSLNQLDIQKAAQLSLYPSHS
jgi:hypothetical protein